MISYFWLITIFCGFISTHEISEIFFGNSSRKIGNFWLWKCTRRLCPRNTSSTKMKRFYPEVTTDDILISFQLQLFLCIYSCPVLEHWSTISIYTDQEKTSSPFGNICGAQIMNENNLNSFESSQEYCCIIDFSQLSSPTTFPFLFFFFLFLPISFELISFLLSHFQTLAITVWTNGGW